MLRFLGMCNFENNVIVNSANILFGTIQIKMFDLILLTEIRFACTFHHPASSTYLYDGAFGLAANKTNQTES